MFVSNKRLSEGNRNKYSYETNVKFVNTSMNEVKKSIIDIIMSSDKDVLTRFWLPFAYQNLVVNMPYFCVMIDLINATSENRLDDDDYEELQVFLSHHWKQIWVQDGVKQFFEFLDILDEECS